VSIKETTDQLIYVLEDDDNKVIALTGKWGTGKSHLWGNLQQASEDGSIRKALYVSLFGLSDMNQIKIKIVQSALPKIEERSVMRENVRIACEGAKKVLNSIHSGFSALDELALLAVPTILKDKMIVLDDIERMHEKLSIDEVLGFIDEYTLQFGARFLLILNSDQLANLEVWNRLSEKVIDEEIRLDTTSIEAFGIANVVTPSVYAEHVGKAVEIAGITNIRIICKVNKVVNRLLRNRESLSNAILARVIPSTVLLTATHYKGIDDGPDINFVLSIGAHSEWSKSHEEGAEPDEASNREGRWKLMLNDLGILSCDEYELLVVEFLQSGLFDIGDVSKIIDRYVAETNKMEAGHQFNEFSDRLIWDHREGEAKLLNDAKAMVTNSHQIDAISITALVETLASLSNGGTVGEEMISNWINNFNSKDYEGFDFDDPFNRPIHSRIQDLFSTTQVKAQIKTTVFDVCKRIKEGSWGKREELVMQSATAEDFEQTINALDIPDLKIFMRQMLNLCSKELHYQSYFGSAMDQFTEACRNIAHDANSVRLGELIQKLFTHAKLQNKLAPDQGKEH
jgi:hypothetical protein